MRAEALIQLRKAIGNTDAQFRDGQFEAIAALVERRARLLVVQRTGWGKSLVYFLATHFLRQLGAGCTVLVGYLPAFQ
jgi:ATP-dependent DNA helicase RecQ